MLIGTSHIAAQSVKEITTAINTHNPDIVAVELDSQRAYALMQEQKNRISLPQIRKIGFKGFVFAKIGQIVQQKLGKMVGVAPGADMKAALIEAQKQKALIALIDQPIGITLRNFSKALTWKEKGRFFLDFWKGIFSPQKQMQKMGLEKLDLRTVPASALIRTLMEDLRQRYPNVYKTLVEDRNHYMVKRLAKLQQAHPGKKIMAIVGAGHVEGMKELLRRIEVV